VALQHHQVVATKASCDRAYLFPEVHELCTTPAFRRRSGWQIGAVTSHCRQLRDRHNAAEDQLGEHGRDLVPLIRWLT
jgi:hypothetical protein